MNGLVLNTQQRILQKVLNYLEMPLDLGANSQGVERSASSFTAEVLIPESNITQSRCAVEYVYGSNFRGI